MAEPTIPADLQDERLINQQDFGSAVRGFVTRLRGGDLGNLPVVIGLIVISTAFYLAEPRFLSSYTIVHLLQNSAPVGIIALGVVLVLLLGEIDLSVGSVSGMGAATAAVLVVYHGQSLVVGILAGILVGLAVGLLYAALYNFVGVPSFVFSLAGLLAFQGGLLWILGKNGTVALRDSALVDFAKFGYVGATWGYLLSFVIVALYLGSDLWNRRRRGAAGLSSGWFPLVIIKAAALLVFLLFLTWYLSADQGWPKIWLLFTVLVVIMDLALRKTTWGRHVFAVGGNEEAARRSGIKVDRIYLSIFALCSTLAAVGGILAMGVLGSVSQSSGTTDTNLRAIAAAVIGGTSLFGGRGSAYSAMLGIVVLEAINAGLNLLNVDSSVRFMVTGAVLLLAVAIDSVSRRARASSGRG